MDLSGGMAPGENRENWNEELQKIVLGYLPSHLPTLKNPT